MGTGRTVYNNKGKPVKKYEPFFSSTHLYEPEPEKIFDTLLPNYVAFDIYHALLESVAAEHGARMTAMDSASKNAAEVIDSLTLSYNRIRQAAITKEIIEIVSGAQALE